MFFHFSIIMIIFKKKNKKFDQILYDSLFHNIENDLRELGFGDISVNKKMKDLNKILYDILLKIDLNLSKKNHIKINKKIISKYFGKKNDENTQIIDEMTSYFSNFSNYCFELPLRNVIRECVNFKN